MARAAFLLLALLMAFGTAEAQVAVYAAGSLRAPLTEAARLFEAEAQGPKLELVFGASGLLRDRITLGEPAQVFASANMEHPQALAAGGNWLPVRVFARNALCALAPASLGVTSSTLVRMLLDPAVKVGTSTPRADPSGDYAFELFAKIGSGGVLEKKALQLTGGPDSPPPPVGRNVYGVLIAQGAADIFITYCTNAVQAVSEQPQLQVVQVPPELNVGADYGLSVRRGAPPAAEAFAALLLSARGREILERHGFLPPPR